MGNGPNLGNGLTSNHDVQTDRGNHESQDDISNMLHTIKKGTKTIPEHVMIMMCEIFQKELIEISNEVYPNDKELS
jgi:hypothetical protein